MSESACAFALLSLLGIPCHDDRHPDLDDRTAPEAPTIRRPEVVVKVGGSLLNWRGLPGRLKDWLEVRGTAGVVLLIGGGEIVDAIRAFDQAHSIASEASHDLALRAMDLTARLVEALAPTFQVSETPEQWGAIWDAGRVPILPPRKPILEDERLALDPLPRSWAVTSDSIAARLAKRLGAKSLILAKSCDLSDGFDRTVASNRGLVDVAFPEAALGIAQVGWLNLRAAIPRVVPLPSSKTERRG